MGTTQDAKAACIHAIELKAGYEVNKKRYCYPKTFQIVVYGNKPSWFGIFSSPEVIRLGANA